LNSAETIETVVIVDAENNVIDTAAKRDVHHSDTPLHRGFSVFIFDALGRLLLQQRAFSKRTWPGVWSNSCCGHPGLNETSEDAAARRLSFELGMADIGLINVLPDFRYRAEKDGVVENEICPVFVGFTDDEPQPNREEVEATKWVDWIAFVASLDDPATDISPWAVMEVRELLASNVFNDLYRSGTTRHG
jgi:isopentenyl-diphosphate delta-isomerase